MKNNSQFFLAELVVIQLPAAVAVRDNPAVKGANKTPEIVNTDPTMDAELLAVFDMAQFLCRFLNMTHISVSLASNSVSDLIRSTIHCSMEMGDEADSLGSLGCSSG